MACTRTRPHAPWHTRPIVRAQAKDCAQAGTHAAGEKREALAPIWAVLLMSVCYRKPSDQQTTKPETRQQTATSRSPVKQAMATTGSTRHDNCARGASRGVRGQIQVGGQSRWAGGALVAFGAVCVRCAPMRRAR